LIRQANYFKVSHPYRKGYLALKSAAAKTQQQRHQL